MTLIFIILIAFLFAFLLVLMHISKEWLKVTKYKVVSTKIPKSFNNFKIVHITDVHSKIFGKENEEVIKKVKKINPDIVVMTGDIIDEKEQKIDEFILMYQEIYKNYPTYYSIGNHERRLGYKKYKYYIEKLKEAGVHVIINGSERVYRNNEYIVINALKFRENMQPRVLTEEKKAKFVKFMRNKLDKMQKSDYNVLLVHDPENFKLYKELGVDLVFSGHIHGGLIRIGKICLLSPRRKFFPKYAYGMNTEDNTTIITSSGMGAASLNIRLFNRPELVEVTMVSSKK